MAKKRLSRLLVVGAVILGTSLAGIGTAAAQTPSPPGFGGCPPIGGPQGNDFRELPAAMGKKGSDTWWGLRGSYGPGVFGQETGFSDKIVEDSANNRYIHARWRSDTNTWSRVGCKPKAPDEKQEDVPRFGGGGNDGSNALYVEILNIRYTFNVLGGMTVQNLPPKYGSVGPVEQVQ